METSEERLNRVKKFVNELIKKRIVLCLETSNAITSN